METFARKVKEHLQYSFMHSLQLVLIILKLTKILDYSWWIIMIPYLFLASVIVLLILTTLTVLVVEALIEN